MPPRDGPKLDQLRTWRNFKERDLTITGEMTKIAQTVRRQERSFGSAGTVFIELCPKALLPKCGMVSLARGVLTLRAADSATRFELDRWLRTGGEMSIIKRCPAGLTRIKLI
jgi:hypothetical protein